MSNPYGASAQTYRIQSVMTASAARSASASAGTPREPTTEVVGSRCVWGGSSGS